MLTNKVDIIFLAIATITQLDTQVVLFIDFINPLGLLCLDF